MPTLIKMPMREPERERAATDDIAAEHENVAERIHVSGDDAASGHEETRTTEQVRQGHTGDHMRYVLAGSLAVIIIAFAIAYFIFWS